jgi:hypothetical protein
MNITQEQDVKEVKRSKYAEVISLLIFAKRELELFYYGKESKTLTDIQEFLKNEGIK